MKINNKNTQERVFIIAEIGNNHEGNFNLAKKLIDKAVEASADAVKFQTIIPNQMVSTNDKVRIEQLKKFQFSKQQFLKLRNYSHKKKIIFLSTPFDLDSARYLNKIVPAFKVSSGDNNFYPLLDYLSKTGKPLLISTGIASINDIKKMVKHIRHNFKNKTLNKSLALLHCVSSYPTPFQSADLIRIKELGKLNCTIGYSDHTLGIEACIIAVSYGARIIEKHFTIDNNYSSFRDHQLSLNPEDFKKLVISIRNTELLIKKNIEINKHKITGQALRRSIITNTNLKKNSIIKFSNLSWVRPGNGLSPGNENLIIGKKLKRNLKTGDHIKLKDVE